MNLRIVTSLEELKERQNRLNSIVNADCLKAMQFIPDRSIDCVI